MTDEEYQIGYVNQVKFINRKIESLIDEILENSKIPPVIIFQADHGPGMLTDFRSSKDTCLRERFSVFAAYYLPGMDVSEIPQDLTPINLFRVIFNEYFDTEDITSIVDTCTVIR